MVARTVEYFGRLDFAFNNAGVAGELDSGSGIGNTNDAGRWCRQRVTLIPSQNRKAGVARLQTAGADIQFRWSIVVRCRLIRHLVSALPFCASEAEIVRKLP
jgi:hypothetical protein